MKLLLSLLSSPSRQETWTHSALASTSFTKLASPTTFPMISMGVACLIQIANVEEETSLKTLRRRCEVSSLLKTMSQRCVFGCQHCSFAALFAASFAASFAALFAAPRFGPHGIPTLSYAAMICFVGAFNFQIVLNAITQFASVFAKRFLM